MLSIAVLTALRQAIASFGPSGAVLNLSAPYTPEVVLRAMEELQA
jgi:xanthine dehydrogenase molybdopterin-binding subunit B